MIHTLIIKRDGRTAEYDISKITNAIEKAWTEVHGTCEPQLLSNVSKMVEKNISQRDEIEVEEIQELVKNALLLVDVKVAKAYIEYATAQKVKREMEMNLSARIDRLINGDKELVNENANKDSRTFSTKRDLIAGQVAKAEGLKMLPLHVREAHLRGDIHFHDADYSPYLPLTNCCLIDLKFMFENGFNMGNAVIGSPKSIQTAVAQTSQIVANVASSQYGGVSMNRLDEILKPYAEMNYSKYLKDAELFSIPNAEHYAKVKTKKDIYDSMQSLEYEINTLYTSQGQTPFSTIGFGLGESWIEREIQKAILNVRLNGLGEDKKTAIFPKLLFGIKNGVNLNPNDPNYDIKQLALRCASERMYPDILNYDTLVRLTGSYKASIK